MGSPSRVALQTQNVDTISDDDVSTLNSSFEPPPAYEGTPQIVDINQGGFHANAIAASELNNNQIFGIGFKNHA